ELFNPDGAAEAQTFLKLVADVLAPVDGAPARRFLFITTIRSDTYELLQSESLLIGIKQDLFNLPPLPLAEFKSLIEGPAQRVTDAGGRLAIDPEVTESLIADAQGADALPLLAFTIERLYAEYGGDGRLTYHNLCAVGGVQGSIEKALAQAV